MQHEQMVVGQRAGGTRYVFGEVRDVERGASTKICPRCGEELFADMDICYGCLYDFSREDPSVRGASVHDPLESVELDEIDEELASPGGGLAVPPRHSKEGVPSADDTIAEPLDAIAMPKLLREDAGESRLFVLVSSPGMEVRVPLPEQGLSVGRDEKNDVVLHSRSVSRNHLRLMPTDGGVVAQDLGATNPAMVRGQPLNGSETLDVGDEVVVCGTSLILVG